MEETGARTSRAREGAKKYREACKEDFIKRLTHIRGRKRERSFSRGLCSGGATIRHESRPCDGRVAARDERTDDSSFRTISWTYGCKPERSLKGFPVRSVYGCLNSPVALHWIRGNGEYKQFVGNRVRKIQEKQINWRHVPTEENPADVGSRGGDVSRLTALWWQGPSWLAKPQDWPPDLVTTSTQESKAEEVKQTRELFALAVEKTENNDAFDALLEKYELWRVLRVGAWIWRFLHNIRTVRKQRIVGPLTTEEIQKQTTFWIKRSQQQAKSSQKFEEDRLQLNVQGNQEGILECRGRIQGHYPIFLPDSSPFTRKLVHRSHVDTLHGGVALTMTKVRELYWVPRLRALVKQVLKASSGCKQFQAMATPPPGLLPIDRTEGSTPFEVIGVDFAGPIAPWASGEDQSDNGKTFVGAEKWLKQVKRDENIKWQ